MLHVLIFWRRCAIQFSRATALSYDMADDFDDRRSKKDDSFYEKWCTITKTMQNKLNLQQFTAVRIN